ncbi:DUF302 domain-containing protein [Mucilaginibacter celer]|uniref:DUF302 domain-containing protein n=1 Tax=Mucilaginibacter celer TaxID=2305508 RepID=A0A494VSF7_9SPHI|nr:DUF302 domain-containing protein [Mucilaginibacter celer]AYL94305.1 DUF302 domain-containing protein [Mucilaginibacter celer]
MESVNSVRHIVLELMSTFDEFVNNLESAAGKFDEPVLLEISHDPKGARAKMEAMAGREGLMIFSRLDHGQLLKLYGIETKAFVYGIGNPLIAGSMTRTNPAAGLYAPVRVMVYQEKGKPVTVEYDEPSSFFGQFGSEIGAVGLALDKKLYDLILAADLGNTDFC